MFTFAAINDEDSSDDDFHFDAPTKEAQEFHLTEMYEDALTRLHAGELESARDLLQSILQNPLLLRAQGESSSSASPMLHLRFSALKNLAEALTKMGSDYHGEALNCYLQAVEMDGRDVGLWNRLGTLAVSLGRFFIARRAFEQGLCCSPRNWLCMEKLLEVLIALGDELACCSMANRLLTFSPSHTRARYVNDVIEGRVDLKTIKEVQWLNNSCGLTPRGVDLLEPKHQTLSFPTKRNWEDEENHRIQKKQRWQSVDIEINEASWVMLASALKSILQKDAVSDAPICSSKDSLVAGLNNSNSTHLVNAQVTFSVQSWIPKDEEMRSINENRKQIGLEVNSPGQAENVAVAAAGGSVTCALQTSKPGVPDFPAAGETGGHHNVEYAVVDAVNNVCNETETYQDLSHERRSSRIERLRAGSTAGHPKGEEADEHGKHFKDLRLLLEPFLIQPACSVDTSKEDSMCSGATETTSVQPSSFQEERIEVRKFIDDTSGNSGVFALGGRLLEKMATAPSAYMKDYSSLLQLEKLLKISSTWKKSLACSLFLAELYVDAASTATNETILKESLGHARHHQYDVLQYVAAEVELSTEGCACTTSSDHKNVREESSFQTNSVLEEGFGRHEVENPATDSVSTSLLAKEVDWSLQVRYHWLNGRIQILSGDQEQGTKHLRTCKSILDVVGEKGCVAPSVFLHHCRVENVVSSLNVQKKLGGLEIVNLIRNSGTKAYEAGHFQEVIETLSPVLFPSTIEGQSHESSIPTRGCSVREIASCHERVGLSLVLSACGQVRPENLVVALRCHERRLEMLVLGADVSDWEKDFTFPPRAADASGQANTSNSGSSECVRLIAEEVKSISRCAVHIRESMESGSSIPVVVPNALLYGLQNLLLTVMGRSVHSIWQRQSADHTDASQGVRLDGVCLVDAAVAFCRLTYLHVESTISQQVCLLVTVHNILAEQGLCCASKDCEGGEGAFLNTAIKHLGALDLRLKLICAGMPQNKEDLVLVSKDKDGKSESVATPENHLVNEAQEATAVTIVEESSCTLRTEEGNVHALLEASRLSSEERDNLESAIDFALDQSFFCLYGLNLRGGSEITSSEGIAEHKNTNRGDYQTKDQCAQVLQYILPYVKSCSRFRLQKLKKVLRAVWAQFPQPPFEVLATNPVDLFLDDPTFDENKLYTMILDGRTISDILDTAYGRQAAHGKSECQGVLEMNRGEFDGADSMSAANSRLKQSEALPLAADISGAEGSESGTRNTEEIAPAHDPYIEVYENLYYLLAQIEDMSASDKWAGYILTKEGEEFIHQNSNLVKYDLIYNPARFESWHRLAHVYDEDVDLLLNDGSKKVGAASWRRKSVYAKRVHASRRRSRRCFLMSLALASTPEQQSEVYGLLALVYFDTLQNVAPSYDQMQHLPSRDESWLYVCEKSSILFERALSYRPDWTHLFYLGKLAEKMEKPYTESLSCFAKAVKMNPTAVDTFYRLHASRLKLLCKKNLEDTNCLQAICRYSYLSSTREKVSKYFGLQHADHVGDGTSLSGEDEELITDSDTCQRLAMVSPENLGKAWKVLFDDCIAALQLCLEGDLKHFHKARYRIAQGFNHLGRTEDIERAKDEISFCFKSHRSPFIIYMWEIDDSSRKNRRKAVSANGGKIVLELAMPESSRKFITCVRKYLLLYLSLCERTGDISTLERAHVNLRADKKFSICLEDISHMALAHYIRALATAINIARSQSSSLNTVHALLDKMFNVFLDHGTSWDAVAQNTAEGKVQGTPQAPEASFYSYIHDYFSYLETSNNVEGLEAVNERIRKRFKSPKLAGANCLQVCRHAAMSWCRALFTALSVITPLRPERLESEVTDDQQPRLILDLQQDAPAVAAYVEPQQVGHGYAVWNDDTGYSITAAESGTAMSSRMKKIHVTHVSPEDLEKASALLRSAYIFYRESASQSFPIQFNLYIRGCHASLTGFGHPSNFSSSRASQVSEPLDISTPRKLLLWAFTLVHGQPSSMAEVVRHCEEHAKAKYKKGSPAAVITSAASGLAGLQGTPDTTDTSCSMEANANHPTQARDVHGSSNSMCETPLNDS